MSDQFNTLHEVFDYIKKQGFNTSEDLLEFARFNPLTKEIIDEAIKRTITARRKTVKAKDIQLPK